MNMKRILFLFWASLVFLVLCGAQATRQMRGEASWYESDKYRDILYASHADLPFGTKLRVTNLLNNLQTEVMINYRIPWSATRILHLSAAAAIQLNITELGIYTPVSIEVLPRRRVFQRAVDPIPSVAIPPVWAVPPAVTPHQEDPEDLASDRDGISSLLR